MKRVILGSLIVLGTVVSVHADTSTYYWRGKGQGTDAQLQAAGQLCDQRYGADKNGAPTSAPYKKCMVRQGWLYGHTAREKTWIDPDTGDTCHDILGGAGSSCGNF